MSKTKIERGKFYGKIKTVKVRKGGRLIAEMPFKQLVKEVAADPNFSLAEHGSRRSNSSDDSLKEAVSLLTRARRHLAGDERAQKVKDAINEFLESRAS